MIEAVLSGFALSPASPFIHRTARPLTGWVLALLPLVLTVYFLRMLPTVASGETLRAAVSWIPVLGVQLSLRLDGLSLLFALLVCSFGVLILVYSNGYVGDEEEAGRYYLFLLAFMASMLGLVLADNLLAIFVFWELTTVTSFLLIGYNHSKQAAREGAFQALIITSAGGAVALMLGFIMLGEAAGSYELSVLLQADVRDHPLYLPAVALIILGAVTKSAQFPFYSWLPAAMEAPSPVSAYLHSATMVKAGVYLLARMLPILGGTAAWELSLVAIGTVTMVLTGIIAPLQNDLKALLANTTISALGVTVLLLGVGTPAAVHAMLVFLVAHALYKASMFLLAGSIDHGAGTRKLDELGGLRRFMPVTFGICVLAVVSMVGVPPILNFLGKEAAYGAIVKESDWPWALAVAAVVAMSGYVAAALMVLRPFLGSPRAPHEPHEVGLGMKLAPGILVGGGLVLGLFHAQANAMLFNPATAASVRVPSHEELKFWHGFNAALWMSLASVTLGTLLFFTRPLRARATQWLGVLKPVGPQTLYDATLRALFTAADAITRLLQNGNLRYYVLTGLASSASLIWYATATRADLAILPTEVRVAPEEYGLAALIVGAVLTSVTITSRLTAVVALGVVGVGVSLFFVILGAPDLAITQILVDTLTVILFVLAFHHLPEFAQLSSGLARLRDAVLCIGAGTLTTLLALSAITNRTAPPVSDYFASAAEPLAHGRNVVNVILVDFRALDTLGEVTVLSMAGVGVYVLLKLRRRQEEH